MKAFKQVVLREDAWTAVAKHLRGEALSENEKELCRLAHDAMVSAPSLSSNEARHVAFP